MTTFEGGTVEVVTTTGHTDGLTVADLAPYPDLGCKRQLIDGVLLVHGVPREQRDSWPEDGRRHELINGVLVVTPAPVPRHQAGVFSLGHVLELGDESFTARLPFEVTITPTELFD